MRRAEDVRASSLSQGSDGRMSHQGVRGEDMS